MLSRLVRRLLVLPLAACSGLAAASIPEFVAASRDPLLVRHVWPARLQQGRDHPVGESGAFGGNALWERKESGRRTIDEQRRGVDFFLQPGLFLDDGAAVRRGQTVLRWAYDWMTDAGNFPGTGDEIHGVSFFLEGAARGALLLRTVAPREHAAFLAATEPKLRACALWFLKPENGRRDPGRNLHPYAHRYFARAAALAWCDRLFDLPAALAEARRYLAEGVAKIGPDGVIPEKGGFDAGYQVAGAMFATHALFALPPDDSRSGELAALRRMIDCIVARIDAAGRLDASGSTRVGLEKDHVGHAKVVNYPAVVTTLVYGAVLLREESYREVAGRVTRAQLP